jgi:hypothetical protein
MWWDSMSINQQQSAFIESLDDIPTPEQAAKLLELGEGDTGAKPDSGEPNAATGTDTTSTASETKAGDDATAGTGEEGKQAPGTKPDTATPTELNPDNAVILAKDGKHTIGYEKLVEAREGEKAWRAKAEDAQRELDALRAQAKQRADAGEAPTQTDTNVDKAQAAIDKGVDPAIFGDFSDEAIAKGIEALVNARVGEVMKVVDAKLAPLQQGKATDADAAHYAAIYAKHPDADSLAESQQLRSWIDAQPSFVRSNYDAVLKAGTTTQVIELFDSFKQATGGGAAADTTTTKAGVKAAAAAAIAKAQETQVPNSLTEIPGGRPGAGATRDEAWSQMDGPALVEAMADASPEQIDRYLNRRV